MTKPEYNDTTRNNDLDEFITPLGLRQRVVSLLARHAFNGPFKVLDPGANLGQWGEVIKEIYPEAVITGVEIMDLPKPPAYDHWIIANYLDWTAEEKYDLIIGNPPYSLRLGGKKKVVAERFIRRSLSWLADQGWLYFILRSNIRHSRERLWKDRGKRTQPGLHQLHHYKEAWALSPRPSFYKEDVRQKEYGTTKTNAHDYDLFTWSSQWKNNYGYSLELDWEYEANGNLYTVCSGYDEPVHLSPSGMVGGQAAGCPYCAGCHLSADAWAIGC